MVITQHIDGSRERYTAEDMTQSSILIVATAAVFILSIIPSTSAFTTSQLLSKHHTHYDSTSTPTTALFAEESTTINTEQPLATKKIEEGSHDELMYALGVNLARQLGDIRPLVENSEELTHVARGLLDTAVGKLDEEDQRVLLGRRGDDLNNIIVERA